MTIKSAQDSPITFKDKANYPNTNTIADVLGRLALGDLLLGQLIQFRRSIDMTAAAQANDGYNVATLSPIVMRSDLLPPAATILRATVRAGGVTGELTADAYGTTPATGHIAVAPNGSIVALTADAITNMDLVYVPERGIVVELFLPVVSGTGVLTIPASLLTGGIGGNGVVLLLEAEALAATVTGKKIVLVPGTAPATTQARLNVAKTQVLFNVATDVVTRARVKLFVALPTGDGLIGTLSAVATTP